MKVLYAAIFALGIALLPLPYAGYQAIKWVLTISCGIGAFKIYESHPSNIRFWGLLFIAILFNPIAPFYMARETWMLFDVIAAIFIIWLLSDQRTPRTPAPERQASSDLLGKLEKAGDKFSNQLIWTSLGVLAVLMLLAYLFHS